MNSKLVMGAMGSKHVENFKTMDLVLTGILKDDYGKYLEYYPPVYVMKRCFEVVRQDEKHVLGLLESITTIMRPKLFVKE